MKKKYFGKEQVEEFRSFAVEKMSQGAKGAEIIASFAQLKGVKKNTVQSVWYGNPRIVELWKDTKRIKGQPKDNGKQKNKVNSSGKNKTDQEKAKGWSDDEDKLLFKAMNDEVKITGSINRAATNVYKLFSDPPRTAKACSVHYSVIKKKYENNPDMGQSVGESPKQDLVSEDGNNRQAQANSIVGSASGTGTLHVLSFPEKYSDMADQLDVGIRTIKNKNSDLENQLEALRKSKEKLEIEHKNLQTEHRELRSEYDNLTKTFRRIRKVMSEHFGEDVVQVKSFKRDASGLIERTPAN